MMSVNSRAQQGAIQKSAKAPLVILKSSIKAVHTTFGAQQAPPQSFIVSRPHRGENSLFYPPNMTEKPVRILSSATTKMFFTQVL